jgi:hypothetical protein
MLETGIQEEVGVVIEGNVLALFESEAFNNSELDNGWRVNRSAIAVGLHAGTACSGSLWLLQDSQLVPEAAVPSCNSVKLGDGVALGICGDY